MKLLNKLSGILKCQLNLLTDRTFILPCAVLNITAGCNSRCIMCDFWKNSNPGELSVGEIQSIADSAARLNLKKFIISGGEPLLHSDFPGVVRALSGTKIKLSLATNGIILDKYAPLVAKYFSTIFVSLDGANPEIYQKVRGVDGLAAMSRNVRMIKSLNPKILIIGRNIIQKSNYANLIPIIELAKAIGLDHISFSAADVKYAAFGRNSKIQQETIKNILLDQEDLFRFKSVIAGLKKIDPGFFSSRFIIEGFKVFSGIYRYYAALAVKSEFPPVRCNLPWLYAVIDADGGLRPCCLHQSLGNIRQVPLEKIVTGPAMVSFRKELKKRKSSMCSHCVYSCAEIHLKMLYGMF